MFKKRSSASVGRRKPSCGTDSDNAAFQLTKAEQCALCIMRCYFLSYARPQSGAWEIAMEKAVETFGVDRGPKVAWHCLCTVQAMRSSRRSMFHFRDPFCACCSKRPTANEAHLMRSLQATGRGRMGEAKLAAMMLCEGNSDGAFLNAITLLKEELSTPVA